MNSFHKKDEVSIYKIVLASLKILNVPLPSKDTCF